MKGFKRYFQIIAGIIISIVFLYLAFRRVDITETLRTIARVKWGYLILAFTATFVGIFVRSFRWRIILNQGLPLRNFIEATFVGQFINNVLPFRMGDFAQGYFLSVKGNISKSTALSTVILERLTDIIPPSLILVFGSFFVFLPDQISRVNVIFVILGLFLFVYSVVRFQKKLVGLFDKLLPNSNFGKRLHGLINNFYAGLGFLKDK